LKIEANEKKYDFDKENEIEQEINEKIKLMIDYREFFLDLNCVISFFK
jgi:hypothetical protein